LSFRVVHPNLLSQPVGVGEREVWFDENGCSHELTEAEHARLLTIPGFECASRYEGQTLEGDGLLQAVMDTFDGEIVTPTEDDLAEKGDDLEEDDTPTDLLDAWLDMDADERCDTVSSLEEFGIDEDFLRVLFDFEAAHLNSPKVLAAVDTAIGHLRPPTNTEKIAQTLVAASAADKVTTKNPPSGKRGK
jgi:hypothetical protein